MTVDKTPVIVIGPGAVGIGIAVLLARSGTQVALIGRDGLIPAAGLKIKEAEYNAQFSTPSNLDNNFTIISSKAYNIDAILDHHRENLKRSQTILYLQNGLGLREKFRDFPNAVQGILWVSAERRSRNEAYWRSGLRIVLDRANPVAVRLVTLLSECGISIIYSERFEVEIYKKLMINLACNPVGALYGIPNSEIHGHPVARRRAIAAAGEIAGLAKQLGHSVELDPVEIVDSIAVKLGDFKSSTLQDREAGRPMELEAILLEPLTLGRTLQIDMPEVSSLYNDLKNGM